MNYKLREWVIFVEVETYDQEDLLHNFLDTFELNYNWGDDDIVQITVRDPSQILYLKNRGIRVEYEKANVLSTPSPVYNDPLLE